MVIKRPVQINKFTFRALLKRALFKLQLIMRIFLFSVLVFLASCNSQSNDNEILKSKKLKVSDSILFPTEFVLFDNLLIISDYGDTDYFKLIDVKSDKVVKQFGRLGDGPCELKPNSILQKVNDSTLGVFDRQNFTYLEFPLENADSIFCQNETKKFDFNIQKLIKLDSEIYLGVGLYDGRYILTNSSNYSIDSVFIEYPFNNDLPISFEEKAMLFQGNFTNNLDKSRIAFATRSSPVLDILSFQNNEVELIKRIQGSTLPIFTSENSGEMVGASLGDHNVWGFLSITSSDSFIYGLYSGKKTKEEYQKSNLVYVYDWDGNIIKKIVLDQEVSDIVVDDSDDYLIGYLDDGKSNLYQFNL